MSDFALTKKKFLQDLFLLLSVSSIILVFKLLVNPYQRGFFCNDESIRYTFKESTISSTMLIFCAIFMPSFIIIISELIKNRKIANKNIICCSKKVPFWLIWNTWCSLEIFLFGVAVQQVLTDIGKYSVGRLRPHFLAVCNPNINCSLTDLSYHLDFDCSRSQFSEKDILEARLSFPSGHSSLSMYSMVYLILYIERNLLCQTSLLFKHVLQFLLFGLALYTGYSRISDHKHHWSDVLTGFFIGFTIAYFTSKSVKNRFSYYHLKPNSAVDLNLNSSNGNRVDDMVI